MTARVVISQEVALGSLVTKGAITGVGLVATASDDTAAVLAWLARLRLLDGVPFEYLVPDAGLLQPETIRFFHIDRNWTDAAVDGALAAGAYGTRDRAEIQEAHASIRDALDDEERTVWGTTATSGSTPQTTGFLLRSRAVSGWPGMIIRAFRGTGRAQRKLQPLRIERLSPSVMIVLFDDEPTAIQIEEPRQGIQFGLRGHDTIPGRWVLPLRDDDGELSDDEVAAPFRRGSAGVLHLTELRKRMAAELGGNATDLTSADLAYHLLRKPYRQDFGTTGTGSGGGPVPFDELLKVVVDRDMILGVPPVSDFFIDRDGLLDDDGLIVLDNLTDDIRTEVVGTARWDALGRLEIDPAVIATLDPKVPRDPRLLVPVDVQAFVSPDGGSPARADVRARGLDEDNGGARMPPPFSDAAPLPAGVHLHWALPDGLTRADPEARGDEADGDLGYRPLPDRWLVTRVGTTLDKLGKRPVTAWMVESATATVTPLSSWRATEFDPSAPGAIPPEQLHPGSGGDAAWAAVYDSAVGRFGFHDPLDGVTDRRAVFTYVVTGWYSVPENDVLHDARTTSAYTSLLAELGWDADGSAMEQATVVSAQRVQAAQTVMEAAGGDPSEVRVISRELGRLHGFAFDTAIELLDVPRPTHPRQSLYHGTVYGVAARGVPKVGAPKAKDVRTSLGPTMSDASAELLADDDDQELLLAAFAHRVLDDAITTDDWSTIDGIRHQRSFVGIPDPAPPIIETIVRDEATPVESRVGGVRKAALPRAADAITLEFIGPDAGVSDRLSARPLLQFDRATPGMMANLLGRKPFEPQRVVETISRPGPRYWQPADPVVVLRGAGRTLRHGHDGRFEPGETLACRLTGQPIQAITGLVRGPDLVAPLGHGGIPPECDDLVEEAALTDPSAIAAIVAVATSPGKPAAELDQSVVEARLTAESTLNRTVRAQVGDLADLTSLSLQDGVLASPVAAKQWLQPWIPLYLEWEATLSRTDRTEGWDLAEIDLDATADRPPTTDRVFTGRAHLAGAATKALANTLDAFLDREARLDIHDRGLLTPAQGADLADLASTLRLADVSVASLSGIVDGLLGFDPLALHDDRAVPTEAPEFVRAGHLKLDKLRLVDAFGQFVDLTGQLNELQLADAYVDADVGTGLAVLPPRFTCPTRMRFRFLDAADDSREARVDETTPVLDRNPVSGYLLPDHADDAIEVFGPDGLPLGQLYHRGVGRSVTWEGPPGVDGPTATGPVPSGSTAHLARMTDAIIRRDVANPTGESPLSALLRVIDTTTWSIDPFGSTGTEHTSVLIGRPIAVVRASVGFDVIDDPAAADLPATEAAARQEALDALADRAVAIRLGSLSRFDDGLLGFFVDDDYSTVFPVHAAVRTNALPVGAHQGFLSSVDEAKEFGDRLDAAPIVSGYVGPESTILLRPGQTRMLTMLLLPGHGVHATAGVVPRKKLELSRSWIAQPLDRIVPSFRVGPVLVDPKSIRMPPISALGPAQQWTRRDTPTSWRDDPIAAASDLARLSDTPAQAQEGWVRAHRDEGGA